MPVTVWLEMILLWWVSQEGADPGGRIVMKKTVESPFPDVDFCCAATRDVLMMMMSVPGQPVVSC